MKASIAWLLLPLIVLTACRRTVTLNQAQVSPRATTAARGAVNVVVNCGDSITATVDPYRIRVTAPDSVGITWNFTGPEHFRISPKPPPAWPFTIADSTGGSGKAAATGPIPVPPAGDSVFHYLIRTSCGRIDVVIDPELIIPPPSPG